jgi:ADP-heptose:LPS heptosyltransferase
MTLHDWTDDLRDFADTAALMENLDLIISSDTSVVHLAGAIGKPVWALLPSVPDWRWFLGRSDSPWYPTMRLFRQQRPMEWGPVMASIREQLQSLVSSRG